MPTTPLTSLRDDSVSDTDHVSITKVEGEILTYLWEAGEPQSSVQLYESIFLARKQDQQAMLSPATIAGALSRMTQQGLLTITYPQDPTRTGRGRRKGYYAPTGSRAEVTVAALEAATLQLTGHPFSFVLAQLCDAAPQNTSESSSPDTGLDELVAALKTLQKAA